MPTIHSVLRVAVLASLMMTLAAPTRAQEPAHSRTARPLPGNAVTHWSTIADEAFTPTQGTNPMAQSRTFAILHASIHDALNAIDRRFEPYTPGLTAAPQASPDAAVAAAAREVLLTLLPEQAARVEAAYGRALASLPDGTAKAAGIATGRAAARATLTRRQGDGFETAIAPAYLPRSGAGEYQFTDPFTFAAQPQWGRVTPFVIDLVEHGVDGPQAPSSMQYARDLAYVKDIGHITSTTRTSEQSEIAQFWYEDSPLGWNRIANTVIRQRGLGLWSAARTFALVNFAMADGFIAGFDAKYRFRFWRPVTAIHAAATDGNPLTEADATWQPFLTTPPVPDYPSTHTVLGWAAAEVLIALFGDKVKYSATSLTLPGVTRGFRGFSAAAEENGESRLYAGIHFRHAVNDGRRQGRSIGRAVARALESVPAEELERRTKNEELRTKNEEVLRSSFSMPQEGSTAMADGHDARGHNDGVGFVMGFLVGTVLGAALGVLLAPKSGAELRADVREAAERGAEAFRKARAARFGESEPDGNT